MMHLFGKQAIILHENGEQFDFQILLLNFRPVSFYEIEHGFDELSHELNESAIHAEAKPRILAFLDAVRQALEDKDVTSLKDYLSDPEHGHFDARQQASVVKAVEMFLATDADKPHLFN